MSPGPRLNPPAGADLAVGVTDNINAPWLAPGDTMYISRAQSLEPGEVGVFQVDGKLVCRQYAEDSEGTVYLFALNRSRRDADLTLPASHDAALVGRVLLPYTLPLPGVE